MVRPVVALALTLVVLVGGSVAEAKRRRGKVVRVERVAAIARNPQVCQVYGPVNGYCYGAKVEVGQEGTVVDENGPKAQVRIKEAIPQQDPCGNVLNWNISLEVISGDLNNIGGQAFFLIDITVGSAMKTMPYNTFQVPSGQQGENAWTAFDAESDGVADIIVTYHPCDETGALNTTSANGSFCMNYYGLKSGGYVRLRQDNVRSCR